MIFIIKFLKYLNFLFIHFTTDFFNNLFLFSFEESFYSKANLSSGLIFFKICYNFSYFSFCNFFIIFLPPYFILSFPFTIHFKYYFSNVLTII